MKHTSVGVGGLVALAAAFGCSAGEPASGGSIATESSALLDTSASRCTTGSVGERLFECETFGGNGRTCATCHGDATGTFSPADAQALYAVDPSAPLFRPIDSDEGLGLSYVRLLNDAVIRAGVDLPANVTIVEKPTARRVFLNRGVPTTMNTPALDPVLMSDGRAPDLVAQALDAVNGHYQPGRQPTSKELSAIAHYEQKLFSSDALASYANGGPAPVLPEGTTDSEKRGRVFFLDGPSGKCAFCHTGPMLNETNAFNPNTATPPGSRFETAFVSEFNVAANPVYTWIFTAADGSTTAVASPDPGRGLVTGNAADAFPAVFKIPVLWGIPKTAPYFHDNSAKTLEDVGLHYQRFFDAAAAKFGDPSMVLSDQDRDDIVAYMKLL